MGSIDKRLENLERRVEATHRPARINVVYEDAPGQVLYTVTVPAMRKVDGGPHHAEEALEQGDQQWGA
jgi:hypothetical protein